MNAPIKPIEVARQDFANDLIGVINNHRLPAFVMLPILTDIESMVRQSMNREYEAANERYQKELEEYHNSLEESEEA